MTYIVSYIIKAPTENKDESNLTHLFKTNIFMFIFKQIQLLINTIKRLSNSLKPCAL